MGRAWIGLGVTTGLAFLLVLAQFANRWTAEFRFDGAIGALQFPLFIHISASDGETLFTGELQPKCTTVEIAHMSLRGQPLQIA